MGKKLFRQINGGEALNNQKSSQLKFCRALVHKNQLLNLQFTTIDLFPELKLTRTKTLMIYNKELVYEPEN